MTESNKNNPFKTPEGYFENFMDGLLDKLSEEKLDLPSEDGFNIPENYFDGVHDSIQKKLNEQQTPVIQLNLYKKYYAVAASIAAILLVVLGLNWNADATLTFESLAESDIESYFENNEYDLSAYEIAEVIPVDELEINDILTNRFEEDNLIDYLDENIDDFEELNLEDYE